MKKNYTLSLDLEAVESLKPMLEMAGLSLSGYVNTLLNESVKGFEKLNVRDISKLTVSEFARMYSDTFEGLQDSKKEDKEKPEK